jgi:hypothetical protein
MSTILRRRWPYLLNPGVFSPLSIPNLGLWLDAADSSTITLDGSNNVEEWRDKSGNLRHATQASALLRPNYQAATINGLNAVTFDAVDDAMNGATLLASDLPFTLFGVVRKNAAATLGQVAYFVIGTDKSFGLSVSANAISFDLSGYLNGTLAWRPGPGVPHANGVTLVQQLSRTPNSTSMLRYPGAVTHSTVELSAPLPSEFIG